MRAQDKREIRNKPLKRIRVLFVLMFIALAANIIYFAMVQAEQLVINDYNPRLDEIEAGVIRGDILDRTGKAIATTKMVGDSQVRVYPYGSIFAHSVGYTGIGKTGLEAYGNLELIRSRNNFNDQLAEVFRKGPAVGNAMITTLDADLQQLSSDLMGDHRGAVVAIEPSTGEILAMVSKPDFDPNNIVNLFEDLRVDKETGALVNRATQGLYPPGSTYKTITAIAYLEKHSEADFFHYCEGEAFVGQKVIHCYDNHAHGRISLDEAFALSCNTAFGVIAEALDGDRLNAISHQFLFNQVIPLEIEANASSFVLTSASTPNDKIETAIGQSDTLITPLNNALVACAVANEGVVYKPHLVKQMVSHEGEVLSSVEKEVYTTIMTPAMANTLEGYMTLTSEKGTAKALNTETYQIASKTGTAEKEDELPYAWYIGYAPVDNPQIALAIVVENVGASSQYAVPIADAIFQAYINPE